MGIPNEMRFDQEDHPEAKRRECDNCSYKTYCKQYGPNYADKHKRKHWLCAICACTFLAHATDYPEQLASGMDVLMKSIGYIANGLLDEIMRSGHR